jgi:hypothetical protein
MLYPQIRLHAVQVKMNVIYGNSNFRSLSNK